MECLDLIGAVPTEHRPKRTRPYGTKACVGWREPTEQDFFASTQSVPRLSVDGNTRQRMN